MRSLKCAYPIYLDVFFNVEDKLALSKVGLYNLPRSSHPNSRIQRPFQIAESDTYVTKENAVRMAFTADHSVVGNLKKQLRRGAPTEIDTVLCVKQGHVLKVDTASNDISCRENWAKGPAVTTAFKTVAIVSVVSPGQWLPTYEPRVL